MLLNVIGEQSSKLILLGAKLQTPFFVFLVATSRWCLHVTLKIKKDNISGVINRLGRFVFDYKKVCLMVGARLGG